MCRRYALFRVINCQTLSVREISLLTLPAIWVAMVNFPSTAAPLNGIYSCWFTWVVCDTFSLRDALLLWTLFLIIKKYSNTKVALLNLTTIILMLARPGHCLWNLPKVRRPRALRGDATATKRNVAKHMVHQLRRISAQSRQTAHSTATRPKLGYRKSRIASAPMLIPTFKQNTTWKLNKPSETFFCVAYSISSVAYNPARVGNVLGKWTHLWRWAPVTFPHQ